jgi:hypothetical protein
MKEIEDPYHYEKPEWLILQEREHRRKLREARTGKPVGTWGGKREGAGKNKKLKEYNTQAFLNLNNIQRQVLEEMGDGKIDAGIQLLINQHI